MVKFNPVARESVVRVESKTYLVIDADTNLPVGKIEAPLDFCTLDEGHCPAGHDMSFHRQQGYLIHNGCLRPTRSWWAASFTDLVKLDKHAELPW